MSVSDNFNRADSGSLGANWTETAHGLQIVSNAVRAISATVYQRAYWSANSWNNDQSSQVTVLASYLDCGALVRMSGSDLGYMAMAHHTLGMRIYRIDAGPTYALLLDLAGTVAAGDTVKLDVTGTTLTYYKNGSSQGTVTDATYSTGNAGIYARDGTVSEIDDWVGTGEIAGGGVTSHLLGTLGVGA